MLIIILYVSQIAWKKSNKLSGARNRKKYAREKYVTYYLVLGKFLEATGNQKSHLKKKL